MKYHPLIVLVGFGLLSACTKATSETKPIRKDVTETVFASGILEASGTYSLTAQNDGYLVAVNFQENDLVQPGTTLALIDNQQNLLNTESADALYQIAKQNTRTNAPSLVQARNSSLAAKQKMELDSVQAGRYQRLLAANSVARTEYEAALLQYNRSKTDYLNSLASYQQLEQQANQQLIINQAQSRVNKVMSGFNQIRAVAPGKVYQKFKQKGDFVRKGDVIATIGDSRLIYAKVNVDESNISKLKVGQEAVVRLNPVKDKQYRGRLAEILPAFNEASQSFICKIAFSDSLDFRIINTQLQANIVVDVHRNAMLIPRAYLSYGNQVRVKGKAAPVKISTGFVSNEWVRVVSGIDDSTVIITDKIQ